MDLIGGQDALGRDGGQGVLAFHALLKSDRFDGAWRMLVPKLNRSQKSGNRSNAPRMIIAD